MGDRITTLIENHEDENGEYRFEHGLSLLIEKGGHKYLMDTGQSGLFYDNALKMGETLEDLDAVILSHGHYDHAGGFQRFLEEVGAPNLLYVGEGFFEGKYRKKRTGEIYYNGISFDKDFLRSYQVPVAEMTEDQKEIGPGITLHRNFDHIVPYEIWNPTFYRKKKREESIVNRTKEDQEERKEKKESTEDKKNNENVEDKKKKENKESTDNKIEYVCDHFQDEMAISLETKQGIFVIAGCSHPGIVNILTTVQKRMEKPIYGVIGGTHLMDAGEERLEKTMEDFKNLGVQFIGVSHCTGDQNIEKLKAFFGKQFCFNNTGNCILLE